MAIDFNGSSTYLALPANGVPGIDVVRRTIAGWFLADAVGDNLIIYVGATALGAGAFMESITIEEVNVGTFRFDWKYLWSATATWRTPTDLSTAVWYHIAVRYDRSSTANDPEMFVDGVLVAESEIGAPSGSAVTGIDSVRMGANAPGTGNFINGKVAGWGHWAEFLSDSEIYHLAMGENPANVRPERLRMDMHLPDVAGRRERAQGLTISTGGTPVANFLDPPKLRPKTQERMALFAGFSPAVAGGDGADAIGMRRMFVIPQFA